MDYNNLDKQSYEKGYKDGKQDAAYEIITQMRYINYNCIQISDSHIIKTILNVSLPVAERIFNSVNTEKWKDFIDFEQFSEIMVII